MSLDIRNVPALGDDACISMLSTCARGGTQRAIDDQVKANREAEFEKLKSCFLEDGVLTIAFTDADLADPDTFSNRSLSIWLTREA